MDMMREEVQRKDPSWDFPGGAAPEGSLPPGGQLPGLLTPAGGQTINAPQGGAPLPVMAPPAMAPSYGSPGAGEDLNALAQLKPIFDSQGEAARALRAIFELCIARGIISREEYMERLKYAPE
jgi:hypothetical protein